MNELICDPIQEKAVFILLDQAALSPRASLVYPNSEARDSKEPRETACQLRYYTGPSRVDFNRRPDKSQSLTTRTLRYWEEAEIIEAVPRSKEISTTTLQNIAKKSSLYD
jgi:hypothetical protein